PTPANLEQVNGPSVVMLLFSLIFLATMIYGPMGAFLVEQFPTNVRYSGVSVALQFGNGWIGGFAPFIATAIVVASGDIFKGLMYTVIVSAFTFVIGSLFIRSKHGVEMQDLDSSHAAPPQQAAHLA